MMLRVMRAWKDEWKPWICVSPFKHSQSIVYIENDTCGTSESHGDPDNFRAEDQIDNGPALMAFWARIQVQFG